MPIDSQVLYNDFDILRFYINRALHLFEIDHTGHFKKSRIGQAKRAQPKILTTKPQYLNLDVFYNRNLN